MDNLISETRTVRGVGPAQYTVPFVIALALTFVLYWSTFTWWWTEWTAPGSFYAHAVFVPFFVAAMLWRNREKLAQTAWRPSWLGLPVLGFSMVLLLIAKGHDITVIKSLSFIMLMLGSTLLLVGGPRTRVILFPLLFVVMMMPLIPDQLINSIAFPIQMASATLATKLLNLLTLQANQQGTMIQMESYRMAVELPCSGFKTLVSLLTFSAAFAYLVEAKMWKRWTLFLTTIPLSLFINALRITFIGIVGELVNGKAAATFHDYSGFIVLILAFMFLFNFAKMMRCESFMGIPLLDEPTGGEEKSKETDSPVVKIEHGQEVRAEEKPQEPVWWQTVLAWRPNPVSMRRTMPYILAINLVLLLTLGADGRVFMPVPPKPPAATSQIPATLTADNVTFKARTTERDYDKLTKEVQEVLNPTRVINREYLGSDGSQIQIFMTAGNGRKVFHDPHTCMLGSNAVLQDVGVVEVPTKYGPIRVQESRYKYTDMNDTYEMMFFYVVESKIVQRTEQVRNSMILQAVLGDSGKPSYFVRVTQKLPGSDTLRREQMFHFITAFWNEVGPVLTGEREAIYEAPPAPIEEKKE